MLTVEGLLKRFGGLTATDNLSLHVEPGELRAVIGPNGAGKTTFFQQLSGELKPDAGRILLGGSDISKDPPHRRARAGVSRSYQITSLFPELTVLQNIMIAVQAARGHSFRFWRPTSTDRSLIDPALGILETVGLSHAKSAVVRDLAHGVQRQLEIGMTLASDPKVLLLDEPMAGMGRHESAEVVELLRSLKGKYAILLVEHDIDAVFALADSISVLVQGRCIATGSPDEIRKSPLVKAAYLGDADDAI